MWDGYQRLGDMSIVEGTTKCPILGLNLDQQEPQDFFKAIMQDLNPVGVVGEHLAGTVKFHILPSLPVGQLSVTPSSCLIPVGPP